MNTDIAHPDITITRSDRRVLNGFLRTHYITDPPFAPELVLCAIVRGRIAGVLAVSRPPLNGAWRTFLPNHVGARERAHLLNASLRTISRVIVAPPFRARGVATALVRAYLDAPLTVHTEAIASMGHANPFFERAGMTHVADAHALRDLRLRRKLAEHGVSVLDLLRLAAMRRITRDTPLHAELLRWANDARATRPLRSHDPAVIATLATLAASRLVAPPRVYMHSVTESRSLAA